MVAAVVGDDDGFAVETADDDGFAVETAVDEGAALFVVEDPELGEEEVA